MGGVLEASTNPFKNIANQISDSNSKKRREHWDSINMNFVKCFEESEKYHPKWRPVYINIYNLCHIGCQIGDEFSGIEYSYGSGDPGVFPQKPKIHDERHFHYQVLVGFTFLDDDHVQKILQIKKEGEYKTGNYVLIKRNCRTFSTELARELISLGDNGRFGSRFVPEEHCIV